MSALCGEDYAAMGRASPMLHSVLQQQQQQGAGQGQGPCCQSGALLSVFCGASQLEWALHALTCQVGTAILRLHVFPSPVWRVVPFDSNTKGCFQAGRQVLIPTG